MADDDDKVDLSVDGLVNYLKKKIRVIKKIKRRDDLSNANDEQRDREIKRYNKIIELLKNIKE